MRSGQLGSVPAPAASQAREFNPGHAPHHRGIGVTPPGLGRENPGGFGGPVCAAGRGCSPLRPTQGAQGVRGEMPPVLSGGRRLPLPGGLGASSLLTGIVQAWRGCRRHGAGPVASKQAKNRLRGRSPGPGPIARSVSRPIPAARPGANAAVWRCDRHGDRGQLPGVGPGRGPRPRAAWSSREGSRHGSSGRLTRTLVNVGIRASPRSRHGSSAGISAAWSDGRRGFRLSRGPRPSGLSSHGQPWPRRMNLTPLDPASGVSTGASLRIIGSGKAGGGGLPANR